MNRLAKFFWFFSVILFLGVLLYVYAYIPEQVGIHADVSGRADEFISRSNFFYMSLGVFFLANIPVFLLRSLLQRTWLRSARSGRPEAARVSLREDIANWLLCFAAIINIFFVLVMAYLTLFNTTDDLQSGSYAALVYTGPVLIALMLIVLVYIFIKKRA